MTVMQPALSKVEESAFNKIVGQLSHDLRSPVRAVGELALWIEEDMDDLGTAVPAQLRAHLRLLQSRAETLQKLVSGIIQYDQIGTQGLVFDGNWEQIMTRVKAAVPGLDAFVFLTRIEASPCILAEDLFVILHALVSNAVQHHHQKDGTISVCVYANAHGVHIVVQDDGPGIADADINRAVRPMCRLHAQNSQSNVGLGLAVVLRIATHYGGQLVLTRPEDDQGLKVVVSLDHCCEQPKQSVQRAQP